MAQLIHVLVAGSALLLAAAATHDAATRTIPNWVPAGLLTLGIVVRALDGHALSGAAAASMVFAVCALAWLRGWLGGGDVKLAAAFALVLPPGQAGAFVLATALAGGVLALLYLALIRIVRRPAPGRRVGLIARFLKAEAWRICRGAPLPYGAAIAAGGFYALQPSLGIG